MTWTPRDSGWIEVICGSMFSGKTEELIRRLRRAVILNRRSRFLSLRLIIVIMQRGLPLIMVSILKRTL